MARGSDAPAVTGETAATDYPGAVAGRETLSQLLARILDQLSVSAWLPAAALVSLLFVVGNLRNADGHLSPALHAIGSSSYATIILLAAAVIVTTVVTQAFEFESIRLLEGYWGHSWIGTKLSEGRTARYLGRRTRLASELKDLDGIAFAVALKAMRDSDVPEAKINLIEQDVRGGLSEVTPGQQVGFSWLDYAQPAHRRRIDALSSALREYPTTAYQIMPTRFGNTMRAYEERAHQAGVAGPLQDYVHDVFDDLPAGLQLSHDQFRSRLDLYASLVLVLLASAVIAAATLTDTNWVAAVATTLLVLALAWLSYRAAIASARAYGSVLAAIARHARDRWSQETAPTR